METLETLQRKHMYSVCSTWVSEEMLKGVQDANVCLWNTRENFTMAYKSNLIFHLNPCTSDSRAVGIHSAPVLSSHSHWLLLHEVSVTAEPAASWLPCANPGVGSSWERHLAGWTAPAVFSARPHGAVWRTQAGGCIGLVFMWISSQVWLPVQSHKD